MKQIKKMWERLKEIPVDDDGCIEKPFEHFEIGTDIMSIWHWIEDTFNVSVAELMGLNEGRVK